MPAPSGSPRRCRARIVRRLGACVAAVRRQARPAAPAGRRRRRRRAWAANGQARPSANSSAPIGGPTSWLSVTKPVMQPGVGDAEVVAATSIGSSVEVVVSANTSAVPSRNIAASTTRDGDRRPVTIVPTSTASTTTRQQVGHDDDPAAVEPVGEHARRTGRRAGRAGTAAPPRARPGTGRGLRGDQQRTGGDRHAVAEVADPGRGEQPAEPGAEAGRQHGLDDGH